MKTINNNKVKGLVKAVLPFCLFSLLPLATGCSPDEFSGASESGLPTVEGTEITVSVDQSTNTVIASAPALLGAYHVWNLPASYATGADALNVWSALQTVKRTYVQAGDKKIIYRIGNRNGFSHGAIEKTIHIDNAMLNLEGVANAIAAENGKEWVVAANVYTIVGHLGYGDRGGDGTNIWIAGMQPVDGLVCYDDIVKFYTGESNSNFNYSGTLNFDPGKDGQIQIGGFDADDNRAQGKIKDAGYTLIAEGDELYMILDPNTPLPFTPSESFLSNPKWRIDYFDKNEIDLVATDGNYAYRMVLTPNGGGEEFGWKGFTEGENLLKDWQPEVTQWFSGDDWQGGLTADISGNIADGLTVVIPQGTGGSKWQGQVALNLGSNYATLSESKNYDLSLVIVSSEDNVGATVKPHPNGDDNTFFTDEVFPLHKGVNVITMPNQAGFNGDFVITFDFAGTPAGTEFTISDIFLTEANDGNVIPLDYTSADNAWKDVEARNAYEMSFWWANNSWTQIADPEFSEEVKSTGAKIYSIVASEGVGSTQWQAQNSFNTTDLAVSASDLVDFSCVVSSEVDQSITIKLCDKSDDNNALFYGDGIQLKAGVPTVLRFEDCQLSNGADASAVKLIFDLAGINPGATFKVTDIVLIKK